MSAAGSVRPSTFSLPALTLVIGGARSGKSRLAERLVTASGRPRTYIATAQPFDAEMQDRITRHRDDRGPDWTTLEAPLDVGQALAACDPAGAVLLDCATLWLSNTLLAGLNLDDATQDLIATLASSPAPLVIVSNEVGWGIVPDNALARQFRDAQGRLNQQIAARAPLVIGVMAGLPFALKGSLPEAIL
ncbi:bifunctional adenosylcobinamide kinase/adenosylcobinamide-phosphate guanylyltransferase [Pseudotabrizicola formosa]|uniref:bifunctional adenosylcobinamide kinase/adenosylcobinamide-phosphate guanylyltransferase n=1 Tax=Pseudotabrizicola formosa TaxID=2030009 RepID=UPI000CD091EA|nr:bifunctional adenosylcobinamide kinase/adenosylcobinamide-phosphate guanylyltransferase [Pseudotabrizicola formosa]